MTPQHIISQLLESDSPYSNNFGLLKKIILATYFGRLQINGQPPDEQISLGSYLFDNEKLMFDFSRLSETKKALFLDWLLKDHQKEKKLDYLNSFATNDYRGFTAETGLSWWGKILQWFKGTYTERWKITDLNFSFHYQLKNIALHQGQQGLLVGFDQLLVPPSGIKYRARDDGQNEPLGNTKRVFVTDKLVDKLIQTNITTLKFESICKSQHPQSIHVNNLKARHQEMHNFRNMQRFISPKPWYVKLINWIFSLFNSNKKKKLVVEPKNTNELELLHEQDKVKIYKRSNKQILVTEERPGIENLVFCGGGAKIFGHVGVLKALDKANLRPRRFAGSSAGAIMAMLCYLGYSAEEITQTIKNFKQEHIVNFDIDSQGLSDATSLKTALDYAVVRKVVEITAKYNLPYPQEKITFAYLARLKQQCPGCGIGDELIVTGTNRRLSKTHYFSNQHTPAMEVSEAVKISSSLPILYRFTLLDGDEYNDGGVLNNFPTDAFFDDHSTLLESEYANNLKLLAVQFDNGNERNAVDKIMSRVYRENFLLNWIYSLLTGVKDPASGWEQDRMKLRKHAAQAIVVDVGNISSSGFSVENSVQQKLIQNGFRATMDYINARYTKDKSYVNKELMYSTFSSFGDFLSYCCYRGNKWWFNIADELIHKIDLPHKQGLLRQSAKLKKLYFNETADDMAKDEPIVAQLADCLAEKKKTHTNTNHQLFLALYPIFLKLSPNMVKAKNDKKLLLLAHHALSIQSPLDCLTHFDNLKGHCHILLYIKIKLLKLLAENINDKKLFQALKKVQQLLGSTLDLEKEDYFGQWNLDRTQCLEILKRLNDNNSRSALKHLSFLKHQGSNKVTNETMEFSKCIPIQISII